MNSKLTKSLLLTIALGLTSLAQAQLRAPQVEAALRKTADWQLAHPNENQLREIGIRQWHIAPLYDGLLRLSYMTGDPKYLGEIVRVGGLANWAPGTRPYHADDYAVGHAWLEIYSLDSKHPERLKLLQKHVDHIIESAPSVDLTWYSEKKTSQRTEKHHDRWSWCDALYMAPPTFVRLYEATGDEKYLDFMEKEWRATHETLFDTESKLYYRDTRYIDQRLENGKKIFWSRGNGWVYGGLALTLEKLPQEHPSRAFLEEIFVDMSASLKARQQADGLWYPNLDDAAHIPSKETSGSGFFVYGLAWGINQGLLPKQEYWPHVEKGWAGLQSCVQASGMLGYVQPVGASPEDNIKAELTHVYGTGTFLMAGSEILKALGKEEVSDKYALLQAAETEATGQGEKQALAVYQPYRKDDIAWENDKMAFRVYGPALRDSPENSGIDCWMKSVPTPIVQKWYDEHLSGKMSYHKDTGEGYDGYKVGPYRGCGGTGLWKNGELVTSNVYRYGHVIWTRPDEAKVSLTYYYGDGNLRETKTISLKVGDELCSVESRFWGPAVNSDTTPFQVAVGLTAQGDKAQALSSRNESWLAIWDQYPNGDEIGTGIILEPDALRDIKQLGKGKNSELIAILETDASNTVRYQMGFTWIRGDLPRNLHDWSQKLAQ
ncbi:glycoside hydrolase family 88 protein [Pelagicoccus mobilis]|uniref:Glycoside hydrolase family 88 protein n=1 Tax=Pelagicoccus mobilis TaxID=415221 RepID=A0A934RX48_9BACT|nr:glycoside hydrolase family 88 protein [Pelagicoccus mobilis]MBK1879355.1 glycoside hydrolase family 88 protein [Pelagicoccus mobilis]